MSTPRVGGRVAQKARTRAALLTATRALIAEGITPTVEEAAAAAEVSRTTAYRYFANQRLLLLAAHPEMAAESMLGDDKPNDAATRLDAIVRNFTSMILETEAQQRTTLRLSLEFDPADRGELPLRQGRAIKWISEAFEDLQTDLSDDDLHLLAVSIRATIGIEALVWLVDVAGLSRADAVELMRWSAHALLQRALQSGTVGSAPSARHRRLTHDGQGHQQG